MKSKRISDYQITASSSYDESQPSKARESKYKGNIFSGFGALKLFGIFS